MDRLDGISSFFSAKLARDGEPERALLEPVSVPWPGAATLPVTAGSRVFVQEYTESILDGEWSLTYAGEPLPRSSVCWNQAGSFDSRDSVISARETQLRSLEVVGIDVRRLRADALENVMAERGLAGRGLF